jgi:D-3-phosphoglycerate dehydrogenase / 2-oxoglutarate reductase
MSTVLLLDADFADRDPEREILTAAGLELVEPDWSEPGDLAELAGSTAGALVMWTPVDAALLDALPGLRAVGRYGIGVDTIDVAEATRRGIAVVHSGDYATEEVAAHALALALALLRAVPAGERAVRSGEWTGGEYFHALRRPSTLRAGVVGLGRIGRRMAAHLEALGMAVAGYDPIARVEGIAQVGSLEELLRRSDLVSLHLPLTDDTRHLIDRERLALMPEGSVLVNTARGGLVDQAALLDALDRGPLAGAGIDVFEEEPLGTGHPLAGRDDVVLSPHVGYFSVEAIAEARRNTVESVVAAVTGGEPRTLANPEVLRAGAGPAEGSR